MARKETKPAPSTPTPDEEVYEDNLDILELDQNLDDIEEPDLLPQGWYVGEVQGVEIRDNQKGTGKYYAIQFTIPTDNFPANYDVENWPEGCQLYYNLVRVPRAGDRRSYTSVKKLMQSLGLSLSTNRIEPNTWIGRPAKLKVIHNEYQGITRESIAPNGVQVAD